MEYADNTGVEFRLDEVIELLREISGKLDELNSKLDNHYQDL